MGPLSLRRYRAERLLRGEFDGLRARVLSSVRARLQASGARLDPADLDACYAHAWQGLYTALLAGEEVSNVAGWLVVVTSRRAVDEHRARMRERPRDLEQASSDGRSTAWQGPYERDLAAELDDRVRLRQLFEGLRGRLSEREREAAALCYLQGLSRSQAAARMGVSEARMRKLMEGRGAGRPGVAQKVGMLVETIVAGGWCEEQGSLMRGLAYGILDGEGDRYRLAVMHSSQCPACRAYVISLRGLAAALPPVLLPSALGGAGAVLAGAGARGALGTAGGGVGAGAAGGGAGAAAGGGWLLAGGGLGAKLAAGCLLAFGVGAGCVALESGADGKRPPNGRGSMDLPGAHTAPGGHGMAWRLIGEVSAGAAGASREGRSAAVAELAASGAGREFGPEYALAQGERRGAARAQRGAPSARPAPVALRAAVGPGAARTTVGAGSAAEREFAPG